MFPGLTVSSLGPTPAPASPGAFRILGIACSVLHYGLLAYGGTICWRAFRMSRNRGWLLLGVFCLLPFLGLGLGQVSHWLVPGAPGRPPASQIAAPEKPPIPARTTVVNLPISSLVLVAGLFLLAPKGLERGRKKSIEPAGGGDSSSATAVES